jgi:hypothetical protein
MSVFSISRFSCTIPPHAEISLSVNSIRSVDRSMRYRFAPSVFLIGKTCLIGGSDAPVTSLIPKYCPNLSLLTAIRNPVCNDRSGIKANLSGRIGREMTEETLGRKVKIRIRQERSRMRRHSLSKRFTV